MDSFRPESLDQPPVRWIAAADDRRAALYACNGVASGGWRLEKARSLESLWEDYHERHRPDVLGQGPAANAAQHFASRGHEEEEEEHRFAHDIAKWLGHAVEELKIDHIVAFAPFRLLSELRRLVADERGRFDWRAGEFAHLDATKLAAEPAVITALAKPIIETGGAATTHPRHGRR